MALRPKTKAAETEEATAPTPAPVTGGPVAVASAGQAQHDGKRPVLRWTKDMDKALVALIAANTDGDTGKCSLTREEAAVELSNHTAFVGVANLVTPQKVGLRAGQLRRPADKRGGGLVGLPRFRSLGGGGLNREFYNPSTIAAELSQEFAQFATKQ